MELDFELLVESIFSGRTLRYHSERTLECRELGNARHPKCFLLMENRTMINLFKFYPAFGLTDPSPFCIKVETFLRMVGAEYERQCLSDPRKGPKGKLPFIRDGDKTVADSTFILKYLIETYRYPIDSHLSPEQHAIGIATIRMLEEHLYWAVVYERWMNPSIRKTICAQFFGHMPPLIRSIVPLIAQSSVKKMLHGQGLGRHGPEEIKILADDDIHALSELLGTREFLLGDRLSSYDASVYGFLSAIIDCTLDTPSRNTALSFENLGRYCGRMKELFYPELGQSLNSVKPTTSVAAQREFQSGR